MKKNPLITDIDLDLLSDALDEVTITTNEHWEVIRDAARNWMEHCGLEQLRKVLGQPSEADYEVTRINPDLIDPDHEQFGAHATGPGRIYQPTDTRNRALVNKFPRGANTESNNFGEDPDNDLCESYGHVWDDGWCQRCGIDRQTVIDLGDEDNPRPRINLDNLDSDD
jgi:hypothetical protein